MTIDQAYMSLIDSKCTQQQWETICALRRSSSKISQILLEENLVEDQQTADRIVDAFLMESFGK